MGLPVLNHNKWTLKITCLRRRIILQTFIDWFHISFQKKPPPVVSLRLCTVHMGIMATHDLMML